MQRKVGLIITSILTVSCLAVALLWPRWIAELRAQGYYQGYLAAAVLPSSRSVQVGTNATVFATVINFGSVTATSCSIALQSAIPVTFNYQATDPITNQVIGSPNTPVNIAAGAAQSFVLSLTATAPIVVTTVQFTFDCSNSDPAPITVGVNTMLFTASATPVPDIIALAGTQNGDGIVNIPGSTGTGVFVVATINLGVSANITASANTGTVSLPVNLSVCQTNPATSACLAPPSATVTTTINAGATPTFGFFVQGSGNVPFDPANNRVFAEFRDGANVIRGSTSVAVRTQ